MAATTDRPPRTFLGSSTHYGLKIMQWNANGINARKNELNQYLATIDGDKPHIICVEETFLKPDKNFNLTGYDIFRKDRTDNIKGGVATFVKTSINAVQIEAPNNVESVGVKVIINKTEILIYNIYNPPKSTIDLNNYKQFFENKNAIITGDLNAKNTLWNSPKQITVAKF